MQGILLRTLASLFLAAVVSGPHLAAQTFLTQDEALELAFPDARVERHTAYLDDRDLERAAERAGSPVEGGVVTHYVAFRGDGPVGVAYFDAHRVRTLDEVLMVALDPEGRVMRVEVLRFSEPPDYLAPEGWLEQFVGHGLSPELMVGRDIVNMTGATLTSAAATEAVRRVLALHEVIAPFRDERERGDGSAGAESRGGEP